jgi:uncharacterized protein (DUF2141 family)
MKLKSTPKFSFYICPKIFFALLILMWTGLIFAQVHQDSVSLGTIKIIITGFKNNVGDCWFAIDNSKEVYEREDSVWIGKILPIENNEVIVVIDSLKYGEYAVKVFHDENKNGELDTDFLGIPDEDYGFSNNVSGWFGPPSWEKAKFIFDQPEMTIRIEVD